MGWQTYTLRNSYSMTFPKKASKKKGTYRRKGIGFLMAYALNGKTIIDITPYKYVCCIPHRCSKEEFEKDCNKLVKRFYQQCSSKYDFKGFKVYNSNGRKKSAVILGRGDLLNNAPPRESKEKLYLSELRCEV